MTTDIKAFFQASADSLNYLRSTKVPARQYTKDILFCYGTRQNQFIKEICMSLIYRISSKQLSIMHGFFDYIGEIRPFAKRVDKKRYKIPLILLKSIEWSIYRWYKTPIRRFYGIKGNELIYMITRRCNDRCPKCGIWETPESNSEHLPITHFIECLRKLHRNLYQVTLTGGEPLLFKDDILLIAEEANKLNV